jgi:ribosomal protein L37AE/L43A
VSRLIPLNAAVCPVCGAKDTKRIGYSSEQKGSIWQCSSCRVDFVVPMLTLKRV